MFSKDVYSYNVEQSRGDGEHNIVSVVMREKGLTVQEAMDHVGVLYRKVAQTYIENSKNLPRFTELGLGVDKLMEQYVYGMAILVTCNIKWSFASGRYFGDNGLKVMQHRTVTLLPTVE